MRLLNTSTRRLEDYSLKPLPKYAILSHRWESEEVSFDDIQSPDCDRSQLKGYSKVRNFCAIAARDGFQYVWLDTCCIDKRSSAELGEAINSMFRWYRNSTMCYVYLFDVQEVTNLADSQWFKRGWTLQELLAPSKLCFLAQDWTFLSDKQFLLDKLESITSIPAKALIGFHPRDFCIAEKMSWSVHRDTTREEDRAYCLMGLFDVNMPLIYGEGHKAFWRLQEAIMETSTDTSIFLWDGPSYENFAMLAASPSCFCVPLFNAGNLIYRRLFNYSRGWTLNNAGIRLELALHPYCLTDQELPVFIAFLREPPSLTFFGIGIFLGAVTDGKDVYRRIAVDGRTTIMLAQSDICKPLQAQTFVTDLSIVREPILKCTSTGNTIFTVDWQSSSITQVSVYQRSSDQAGVRPKSWPVFTSASLASNLYYQFKATEAQGIVGSMLFSFPRFHDVLVCHGFDLRFRPICIVTLCDGGFFNDNLQIWNVEHAYYKLLPFDAEHNEAFDRASGTYALRGSHTWTTFTLYNGSMSLSLALTCLKFRSYNMLLDSENDRETLLCTDEERRAARFKLFHSPTS